MKVACCFALAAIRAFASGPVDLAVERLPGPVGVQEPRPRLCWRLPDGTKTQVAYEIEANGRSSGRIAGSAQIDVPRHGARLFRCAVRADCYRRPPYARRSHYMEFRD